MHPSSAWRLQAVIVGNGPCRGSVPRENRAPQRGCGNAAAGRAAMGLGLSISRRIIEDHGGNLRLTEKSSKGCLFEITLPVWQRATLRQFLSQAVGR
jgi:hypothetical protein